MTDTASAASSVSSVARDGSGSSAGFAVEAARLVETARNNERAVRDLDEAVQLLAAGVDDLAQAEDLASALADVTDQIGRARDAAATLQQASDAVGDLAAVSDAAEEATRLMEPISATLAGIAERVEALDERLNEADEQLSAALEHLNAVDLAETVGRIDALESKLDRVLELLGSRADTYAENFEPRVSELEALAEKMDAPALTDGLADVLATDRAIFEMLDSRRADNDAFRRFIDRTIDEWHERHGEE